MQTSCVDCGAPVAAIEGRGRPRKRCIACSPRQLGKAFYRKGPPRQVQCQAQECVAVFVTTNPARKYCGDECRNRECNRAAQERRRDRSPRPCRFCKEEFSPGYGDLQTVYCSTECRRRYAYLVKSGSTHRRRAKKHGRRYEPINKWSVFERDGWKCRMCGCETPRELSGSRHPRSPELDHIVPIAAGGDHVIGNVQCSCRSCNQAKGARLTARG